MDKVTGQLLIFFEEPFWVGVFEHTEEGRLSVCKVVFGAEPKGIEICNFILEDYQRNRITSFIFSHDPLGESWSREQAKVAVGSGQIFGKGLTKDTQVQYGFLPEPHTDFIFAAIAEEWGLVGIITLFLSYGFLVWRVLKIAIESNSNFPRLFASGFAIILISQFFINIGMNLSMMPVVGIYLPFISYGGSGLIFNFMILGILQSVNIRK